jgi:outer membrane protein assembly factor BamB
VLRFIAAVQLIRVAARNRLPERVSTGHATAALNRRTPKTTLNVEFRHDWKPHRRSEPMHFMRVSRLFACLFIASAWLIECSLGGQEQSDTRQYENRLTPLVDAKPLLADHPQFVEPIRELGRFEAPTLVDDPDADLFVRAWRFSYNARGIIEMPNRLRASATAIVMVHPWGIDDGQGWITPEPAGVCDFCTPDKNHLAARHTREVIDPFHQSLRGKVAFVMYSLPGREDPIRKKLYRSIRGRPSDADRSEGAKELKEKLNSFSYRGQPLPQTLTLTRNQPVIDYFKQFPGLDAGARYNGAGFWELPIPVTRDIAVRTDDVIIYDAEGYEPVKQFLQRNGVRHILLTGYATDMCYCRTTAGYENLSRDFNVFLVGDCTLATFPANSEPRFATNAAISFASLNQLVTQVSWIQYGVKSTDVKIRQELDKTNNRTDSQILKCVDPTPAHSEDWPQFRGPGGQGHSSEQELPVRWSETENVRWKVPIPGLGWSSPVIRDDQTWLTTATDDGRSLRALCLDRQDGRLIHNVELFRRSQPDSIHQKNSHASPTPIIDENRVYAHFGPNGTACVSTNCEVIWKTQVPYDPVHGPGGSPALFEDLVIMSCDGGETQYVVALDKMTGEIRWKCDRNGGRHSYSTPQLIEVNGAVQLVSTGGDKVVAYNPRTGDEIWQSSYDGYSLVPRPVFGHGLVFVCSGYNNPVLYAIRPDGHGDVTDTHVAWQVTQAVPHNPSPLLVGNELYTVSDGGIATCLDAESGKTHWRQRLNGAFSASPVFADGHIFWLNENGETTVITPGVKYKELAKNTVNGRTQASLAVSHGAIYLRTASHLYCIENTR